MEQHYEKFQRGYSPGKRYGRAWKRIRDRYVHVVRVTRRFTTSAATGRAVKISTTLFPGKRRGVFYAKIAIQTGY